MTSVDATHDPRRESWVAGATGHAEFPIQNLPLGVFSPPGGRPRAGVAIGDDILCLATVARHLPNAVARCVAAPTLNALLALPPAERVALRRRLSEMLADDAHQAALEPALHRQDACEMHLPCAIGDYTDFYVGIHHATNVGRQFRPDNPLLPNYKWVPIGYHGRASSVRSAGVPVVRPSGQRKSPDIEAPVFGPTQRLDYEVELGVWIGGGNDLGTTIPIGGAADHIGGFCLLNDWSARDLQAWEYQPLGPFLAKNFHTTVSPWIVTAEAMAPFRVAQPRRPEGDPKPLPHLWDDADQAEGALSVTLRATLSSPAMRERGMSPLVLSTASATNMYWTVAQIVAHHASNGCNLATGDLLGSGTISGPERSEAGSLLEISRGGLAPVILPTGETRAFLEDGDELTLSATAHAPGHVSIGFGSCHAVIVGSADYPATAIVR